MPEELGIAIVILVVAVWLVVKVFQAVGRALAETQKGLSEGIGKRVNASRVRRKGRLSEYVTVVLPGQLDSAEKELDQAETHLRQVIAAKRSLPQRPSWGRHEFRFFNLLPQDEKYTQMDVDDLRSILLTSAETWLDQEGQLINRQCRYPGVPPVTTQFEFSPVDTVTLRTDQAVFQYDSSKVAESKINEYFAAEQSAVVDYNRRRSAALTRCEELNARIREWNEKSRREWEAYVAQSELLTEGERRAYRQAADLYVAQCEQQRRSFGETLAGYKNGVKEDVVNRIGHVLACMTLPRSVPRTWEFDFDEEERILIIDMGLPDVVHHPPLKRVMLKKGPVKKPLSQTEKKEIIPRVHPAILLRVAHEVFRNDATPAVIKLLVLNGWVKYDDPSTGVRTKAYTASLMVEPAQIVGLNIDKIDPLAAFESLRGKSAGKLVEIIPIEPVLSLNRKDSRFVDGGWPTFDFLLLTPSQTRGCPTFRGFRKVGTTDPDATFILPTNRTYPRSATPPASSPPSSPSSTPG